MSSVSLMFAPSRVTRKIPCHSTRAILLPIERKVEFVTISELFIGNVGRNSGKKNSRTVSVEKMYGQQ